MPSTSCSQANHGRLAPRAVGSSARDDTGKERMSQTVGDYLLERLATWGINGIMGAFTRSSNGERPEFIQARHEEMAAFMACAHAKFTGQVGVCMATSGP